MLEHLETENYYDYTHVSKNDVTVVVPTLNEEKAIGLVLRGLLLEGFSKLLVVDGNSIDRTVEIAERMDVEAIPQKGQGKTGAIATAISRIKTPYFVVIDGDYTYKPSDIENLIKKASSFNHIIGARQDQKNIKLLNRFGNKMINLLFNLFFGSNINDVCSGLYLLKTSFARELFLETKGFDVEVEIAAQSAINQVITEVPISYDKRIGIQKLNPLKDGFIIVSTIFRLAKKYNPLMFYSFLASGLTIFFGLSVFTLSALKIINFNFDNVGSLQFIAVIPFLFMGYFVLQYRFVKSGKYKFINKPFPGT